MRIVNFDVVVADRTGNHIGGLTKDDFELYENGKPQEISNFSEYGERRSDAVSEPPPRNIVIFFDVLSTDLFARKRVSTAVRSFLQSLRPADGVMIVSWNRRLKVVVPPTNDRARLEEGLDRVVREPSFGTASTLLKDFGQSSPVEARAVARTQARMLANDLKETAAAVESVLAKLTAVGGRKVLILITEGLPLHPGQELFDPARDQSLTEDDELSGRQTIDGLARKANAAGVTLFTVHAQGLESGMSVEDTSPSLADIRQRRIGNSLQSLTYLADRTGGLVAANRNDFRRSFDNIAADLSSYYSLAYRVSAQRTDRERNVEIRAKNKELTVRARRSFMERSFESEIVDQVVANLTFPISSNDLGITARVAPANKTGRRRLAVPIDVLIPYASLAFAPDGAEYAADLSLYIAAIDGKGGMSNVMRLQHCVTLSLEKLGKMSGKHYTYGVDVDLTTPSAENRIAIAVLDNVSKMIGYATVEVKKK